MRLPNRPGAIYGTCMRKCVFELSLTWSSHLYVQTDEADMQNFLVTHDLSRIESLHVRATRITSSLALILRSTPRIHTLDLAYLYFRTFPKNIAVSMNYPLQPLPRFPQLVSRPRVVRYCSRLDLVHEIATDVDWIEKARATRYPFATLLHELDISQVEQLEISAESLALPFAVAYTWSSLRVLVITGFWISNDSETPLDDARLKTPASIFEHVHLGTLINATPNLRILRIRWRYDFLPEPRRTVWPPGDVSQLKTFGGALEVFELYNPSALDGVYTRLPRTLRSLSLLTHPHGTHGTNMLKEYELREVNIANPYIAVLRPLDIERILTLTELPCLRDLRLSFRGQEGTRLFDFIAETFPLLEVLELHAETGPGCIWQTPQLVCLSDVRLRIKLTYFIIDCVRPSSIPAFTIALAETEYFSAGAIARAVDAMSRAHVLPRNPGAESKIWHPPRRSRRRTIW